MVVRSFQKSPVMAPCWRRDGTTAVEAAIAYNVFFLLLIGLLVGSTGVFRYQEVASLTREAARYASTRGTQYESEVSGAKAATAADVYNNVIAPRAVLVDKSKLKYTVTWDTTNAPVRVTSSGEVISNMVTVTITYEWMPELFFFGPIELSSSSTMPMTF